MNNATDRIQEIIERVKSVNKAPEKRVSKSISVEFTDINANNIKMKFNKAYALVAKSIGVKLKKEKRNNAEGFYYDTQKELTERWLKYFDDLSHNIYVGVCSFLGLPECNVVQKANVTYKGKILYNPETGKPLNKVDLDRLVKYVKKFLNYNRKAGEQIVTDAQVLGKILEKLATNNTPEGLRKLKLNELKYKNTGFDKLVETENKIASVFNLDRDDYNRIQLIRQSAATRIQGINAKVESDIQSVLIDGIRNKKSKNQVSQDLFNKLGRLNRDWKRIADTEIQNNLNHSYIQEAVKENQGKKTYFKRMEVIDSRTCPYCRRMNGVVALFSTSPMDNDKIKDDNANYAIWEGKEWSGENNTLCTGVFHANCRGVWIRWNIQSKIN